MIIARWDVTWMFSKLGLILLFVFVSPQIWDLADPDGKGFLDKQVEN